jgi:adenine-specific DNA-methyltransferase
VTAAQAAERWPNLTLKKIPKAVLSSCEWGHDDYSLNVANLPMAQPDTKAESTDPAKGQRRRAGTAAESGQAPLFGEDAP